MDKMDSSSGTFVLTVTHNHPAVLFGRDAPLLFHLTNPGFLEGGWLGLGAAGCRGYCWPLHHIIATGRPASGARSRE